MQPPNVTKYWLNVAKFLAYEEKLDQWNSFILEASDLSSNHSWLAEPWAVVRWWCQGCTSVFQSSLPCLKSTLSGFYSVSSSSLSFYVWVLRDLWPWCLLLVWFWRRCQYNKCRVGSKQVLPNAWRATVLERQELVLWFNFVLELYFFLVLPTGQQYYHAIKAASEWSLCVFSRGVWQRGRRPWARRTGRTSVWS